MEIIWRIRKTFTFSSYQTNIRLKGFYIPSGNSDRNWSLHCFQCTKGKQSGYISRGVVKEMQSLTVVACETDSFSSITPVTRENWQPISSSINETLDVYHGHVPFKSLPIHNNLCDSKCISSCTHTHTVNHV